MADARSVVAQRRPTVEVKLASVQLRGDKTPEIDANCYDQIWLDRSILDLGTFRVSRRLPLLFDVISAPSVSPDNILIYTNIDIGLLPHFYLLIDEIFSRGADCAVINRRTISESYRDVSDLSFMIHEAGAPHQGFDCFAFRGWLRDAILPFSSCLGIGGVMKPLLYSLLAKAVNPVILLDAHATFHIGDDRTWLDPDFLDYAAFNRAEEDRVFDLLCSDALTADRLITRLQGAHVPGVFPQRLRRRVGITQDSENTPRRGSMRWLRRKIHDVLRTGFRVSR
jgi:hypothetical protein